MFIRLPPRLLVVILPFFAATQVMAAPPSVVATIKPIHSLVAGVMAGVAQPELLLKAAGSPHHYNLKPSARRLLAKARVIFWVGPELEGFMPHLLENLENVAAVPLMKAKGLKLLPARSGHNNRATTSWGNDAHIWLSTENAHALVVEINQRLAVSDPENKKNYARNARVMHKKIDQLRTRLRDQLRNVHNSFIGYHDSYQYFEREFALRSVGFVSQSSATLPGARHIQELRQSLKQNPVVCAVYDAQNIPPIMATLIRNMNINTAFIDPLAGTMEAGESLWFNLMRAIGNELKHCLTTA